MQVPKHIEMFIGRQVDGSNCFNLVMQFFKKKFQISFVRDFQVENWLRNSELELVTYNQSFKYGDILVMRDDEGDPVHLAVFIGSKGWLNQRGSGGMVMVESLESIKEAYHGASVDFFRRRHA